MIKNINFKEIFAYYEEKKKKKSSFINFSLLQNFSKKCRGAIFDDLKIYMILTIKWHFDYLAKTRSNPEDLNKSLNFWYNIFFIFFQLSKNGWVKKNFKKSNNIDVWNSTRKSFNFMWPRNTDANNFAISKFLAKIRLKQVILKISKKKNFFKDKVILDSGCGPGRYIDSMLKYNPKKIIGIDSGKSIIEINKKRFRKYKNVQFINSKIDRINLDDRSIDFLISAGVLHHTKTNINTLIKDHARVIRPGGFFFVFIVGSGGQELDLWKFCRKVMFDVDIKYVFNVLRNKISPLRLQGFLDHSYGEYKSTSRDYFEKILKSHFKSVHKLEGVKGADVTKNTFFNDKFFKKRFGSGNLRYLCKK